MFSGHHHPQRFGRGDACGPRHMRDGHERGWGRGGGRGGPGGPWGERGRRSRPFEQGDLRFLVMDLIAEQPRHGYELIKAIEDQLSGHYSPSPGVIYPTLTLLEETGLVASEAQGAKKLYRLTGEGRAWLETEAQGVRAARERLAEARTRFGGEPRPEIQRALGNLRAAMQVRLSRGDLSSEAVGAITAILDRAAGEIERS